MDILVWIEAAYYGMQRLRDQLNAAVIGTYREAKPMSAWSSPQILGELRLFASSGWPQRVRARRHASLPMLPPLLALNAV